MVMDWFRRLLVPFSRRFGFEGYVDISVIAVDPHFVLAAAAVVVAVDGYEVVVAIGIVAHVVQCSPGPEIAHVDVSFVTQILAAQWGQTAKH